MIGAASPTVRIRVLLIRVRFFGAVNDQHFDRPPGRLDPEAELFRQSGEY
jgi:hypothetical protein